MIQQLLQTFSPRMNGIGLKIGIIVARYNQQSINAMFSQVYESLRLYGVAPEDIRVISVPGSDELAKVAQRILSGDFYDAIICLGCVAKGGTRYHLPVENPPTQGFQWVAFSSGIPVIFGLTDIEQQQFDDQIKRAADCAYLAIKMGRTFKMQ